ncbi:hypothetical protein RCL1_007643 [Eukaryota sp. TZLM3-RCL]
MNSPKWLSPFFDLEQDFGLICLGLSSLYLIIILCSLFFLYAHFKSFTEVKRWRIHFGFLILVFLNASLRFTYFLFASKFEDQPFTEMSFSKRLVYEVLSQAPGLFCFTSCTLLILYLRNLCYVAGALSLPTNKLQYRLFQIVNILYYLASLSIWIFVSFKPIYEDTTTDIQRFFFMAACVSLSFGFVKYGNALKSAFKAMPLLSPAVRKQMTSVSAVTLICGVCFCVRGFFQILMTLDIDWADALEFNAWFIFIYFVVIDLFPFSVLMFLLNSMPKKSTSTRNIHAYTRV